MTQDNYMAEVFPQPPLTAFKRQKNLRDILVKAKVPDIPKQYSQRQKKGMSKCGNQCTACPYIKTGNRVKIKENSYWNINREVNCKNFIIIYMIECDKEKCHQKYIGETGRIFKFRYVNTKDESQPTGWHFNLPGHSLAILRQQF